ncbi:saccharopine dehydrogenase (NAD+, L-lysine-forming) [Saccharothrix ecbatanensis]|uniref:Saccharopine dehydrogenase (NAD+, L-lysine-forming) n=1 Tax=Saccharothrix ecbatanensis TaxID=1105145 RepID=A0A7W9M5T6_9PSEU|nr:saccharopine dehydrogenase NADP-binding domain-containing protein [Saccharothrix ecbatanensis]MBB5808423.1 saccharopine dehydrogenase (NAD+, L-lysine-forming) [Saccharothrix ecbatanensis]
MTWMVYGANGFTGTLVAELAVRRGLRPVLAGRDAVKVRALAERLGLEHRIFDLDHAVAALEDVDAVAHCAGPFSATSGPMVAACLASRTHYVDITGEIDVFEAVARQDKAAKDAGVVLLPGAGFDVVPTDCVAAMLHQSLPTATHLDLAFVVQGGASAGTARTAVEGSGGGGRVRENGEIRGARLGHRRRTAHFRDRPRDVGAIPWGDVSTAYRSTGIPNITTFTTLPGVLSKLQPFTAPLLRTGLGQRLGKAVAKRIPGPNDGTRGRTRCEVFGEVWDDEGNRARLALTGPNAYDLTADSVVKAIERLGDTPPGAHTPSSAFGADYVRALDGVVVGEAEVVSAGGQQ